MKFALLLIIATIFIFGCSESNQVVTFENASINELPSAEGDHQLSFNLNNQASIPAKCIINLDLGENSTSFNAGIIDSNSIKQLSMSFTMPEGDSNIKFTHNCSFSSN